MWFFKFFYLFLYCKQSLAAIHPKSLSKILPVLNKNPVPSYLIHSLHYFLNQSRTARFRSLIFCDLYIICWLIWLLPTSKSCLYRIEAVQKKFRERLERNFLFVCFSVILPCNHFFIISGNFGCREKNILWAVRPARNESTSCYQTAESVATEQSATPPCVRPSVGVCVCEGMSCVFACVLI